MYPVSNPSPTVAKPPAALKLSFAHKDGRWPFDVVLSEVCIDYRIDRRLLLHPSRCMKDAALVRQIAMYLAHVVLGRTMTDVGSAFGRDRSTVAHACSKIEDMREDLDIDTRLDALTERIETCLAAGQGRGHA